MVRIGAALIDIPWKTALEDCHRETDDPNIAATSPDSWPVPKFVSACMLYTPGVWFRVFFAIFAPPLNYEFLRSPKVPKSAFFPEIVSFAQRDRILGGVRIGNRHAHTQTDGHT